VLMINIYTFFPDAISDATIIFVFNGHHLNSKFCAEMSHETFI